MLKESGCEDMEWIHLALDRGNWTGLLTPRAELCGSIELAISILPKYDHFQTRCHTLKHHKYRYLPRPILARVLRTDSLGGGKVCCVSVARHSPSPWGRDPNTFIEGSSTENSRPTLVASSQYASLHHPRSALSPEIEKKKCSVVHE
jgi:hypothetical protein